MRAPRSGPFLLIAGVGVAVLAATVHVGRAETVEPNAAVLPAPRTEGGAALADTLRLRRSVREFDGTPLSRAELGQLLWAAQGVTDDQGFRTAPSAGAKFPTELYLVDASGVSHYAPAAHALDRVADGDRRRALSDAAFSQAWIADAPAVLVITAVVSRTAAKYGGRAERYCLIEAGHVGQNVLLQAVALELGAVPVGGFDDAQVARAVSLPEGHEPMLLIPVGRPAP